MASRVSHLRKNDRSEQFKFENREIPAEICYEIGRRSPNDTLSVGLSELAHASQSSLRHIVEAATQEPPNQFILTAVATICQIRRELSHLSGESMDVFHWQTIQRDALRPLLQPNPGHMV